MGKNAYKQLCREEKGIMKAKKSIYKVSPSYKKYIRNLSILKNNMDYKQAMLESRESGIVEKNRERM
jgi:hypothetical protein